MLRKFLSLIVLVVALATVRAARADTLSYAGYSVIDAQTVTLSDDALNVHESGLAGEITLLKINGGTGTVSSFCIDIADWLTSSGQFATGGYLTGSFGNTVNALLTHVLPTIGSNSDVSAALQVAIWQAEYGTSLTVSGSNDVLALANLYLGDVSSGTWTANSSMQVAVLDGGGKDQSQAYLARVPEPASLALLGVALLGAAAWHYRRPSTPHPYSRLTRLSINCRPTKR